MAGKIAGLISRQTICFQPQFVIPRSFNNFYVTKSGQLFVWGDNEYGKLGFSDYSRDCLKPTLVMLPKNERISFIACDYDHSICVTSNNLCYVWGSNDFGQLGLGDNIDRPSPTLLTLPNNERIAFITCADSHTSCLTENNLCYVWGSNEYGQLGLGDKTNRLTPTLFSLPNNDKIIYITCGTYHSTCLTQNKLCYVWGYNYCGQLGLDDLLDRPSPTLLSLPNNERISFITCGDCYTICLTENNLCYVWGDNEYGQLGLGDKDLRLKPTLFTLPNNERIFYITCGYNHTICLTENNLCYVWGYNKYGQLGLGNTDDYLEPTLFSLPNNERISFVICGYSHTLCLTETNSCYVWGDNENGQLGLGDTKSQLVPTLLSLPRNE